MNGAQLQQRLLPLLDRPEVELAVLFGSYARGTAGPASDVDLAVRLTEGASIEDLRLEVQRALGSDRVDLVDLRRAPPLLLMSIARFGLPLVQRRDSAFAEFVSYALRRFNDTEKLRRAREEGLQAFLRERRLA